MTLDQIKSNQTVQIDHIQGGWGIRQRLNQMGIFEGGHIKVKRHSRFGGPLVIEYNNSEVAIGRGMAAHILVKPHEPKDTSNS